MAIAVSAVGMGLHAALRSVRCTCALITFALLLITAAAPRVMRPSPVGVMVMAGSCFLAMAPIPAPCDPF